MLLLPRRVLVPAGLHTHPVLVTRDITVDWGAIFGFTCGEVEVTVGMFEVPITVTEKSALVDSM